MEDLALLDLFWASVPLFLLYLLVDWLLRKPRVNGVSDKYVFITGCDSGFGRLAARKLDSMGCHVFAGCLTEEGLMEVSMEASDRLIPIMLDVTKPDNIRKVYRLVASLLPKGKVLWGLVNNAGVTGKLGPLEWIQDQDIRSVMEINLVGMTNMVNTFLPMLKESGGRIVNTSSVLGLMALPYTGAYSVSKHAVEAYSDALRRELYQWGVKVSLVEPGGHMTPFMDKLPDDLQSSWQRLDADTQAAYGLSYLQQISFLSHTLMTRLASSRPEKVVACYRHALFARWPRARYTAGRDVLLYHLARWLPTWAVDAALQLPLLRAVPEKGAVPEKEGTKTES